MTDLIPPTVNLNGESYTALIAKHMNAVHALDAAIKAAGLCMPHGRDYPRGLTAIYAARDAFEARLLTLVAIRNDLETVALAIHKQREG